VVCFVAEDYAAVVVDESGEGEEEGGVVAEVLDY
jgi:predicted acyl esterase